MHLLLIRHAETPDNLAGLYAGTRDSPLTTHGTHQAARLGAALAPSSPSAPPQRALLTHLFCSPLRRARATAEAVARAQARAGTTAAAAEVVVVGELAERGFGGMEGRAVAGGAGSWEGAETKEAVGRRAEAFVEGYLVPLVGGGEEVRVAVVAHGVLLGVLWRRLLARMKRREVVVGEEVERERGQVVLERLGGWSNTGFWEVEVCRDENGDLTEENGGQTLTPRDETASDSKTPRGWRMTILAVDNKRHLHGLKRQRGGIGSMAHDEGQRTLDGFFKRPRRE